MCPRTLLPCRLRLPPVLRPLPAPLLAAPSSSVSVSVPKTTLAQAQAPTRTIDLLLLADHELTRMSRNVGAYAEVFDISCLPELTYGAVTDLVWTTWEHTPKSISAATIVNDFALIKPAFVLGQHYFIPNPITGTGLSPKWDFTSASFAGNANAFVVGAKSGDVPAPTAPKTNVDWLSLNGVQGELAQQVFRMETRGGQPPASVSSPRSAC